MLISPRLAADCPPIAPRGRCLPREAVRGAAEYLFRKERAQPATASFSEIAPTSLRREKWYQRCDMSGVMFELRRCLRALQIHAPPTRLTPEAAEQRRRRQGNATRHAPSSTPTAMQVRR